MELENECTNELVYLMTVFLILLAICEVSYIWGNRALIANRHTSELVYLATMVLICLALSERLAMFREIEHLLPINVPVSMHEREREREREKARESESERGKLELEKS